MHSRRMALAALFFPEARTLGLAEDEPFALGSAAHPLAHTAFCHAASDPAFAVPAADELLQRGALTPHAAVQTGWLPLLLRGLSSRDVTLRYFPLQYVIVIAPALQQKEMCLFGSRAVFAALVIGSSALSVKKGALSVQERGVQRHCASHTSASQHQ